MRAKAKGYIRELQVGIFVLLTCMIIAAFSLRITDAPVFRRGTPLTLYLGDATGIFLDSKVKMAGINVGIISSIELEGGKAKIGILIDRGINIPNDAKIVPRPLGILGDKYLEVVLPQNEKDRESPSDQSFYRWLDILIPSLHAQNLPTSAPAAKEKEIYKPGQVVKSSDASVTIDDLTRKMGAVSEDLKVISGSLKKLIKDNQNELTQMIHSMNRVVQKIEKSIQGFDEKKLQKDLKNLSESVGSFGATLKNMESITAKVDRGEGTLGKLVNDPSTANELNRALTTINAVVEKARRTLTIVDMRSEFNAGPSTTKTYASLTIQPREDTAYIGAVVIDPAGTYKKKVVSTRTLPSGVPTEVEVVTKDRSALKYSLQFMKRISSLSVRLGLFESTGGFAIDSFFFRDDLKLTAELFDWSRDANNPHLKLSAQLRFLDYFYIVAGGDDLIAKKDPPFTESSFFAGVGLRFTDEDLKTLLTLQSIP